MRALTESAGVSPSPAEIGQGRLGGYNRAPMHPFLRNLVIGLVGLVVAGGLSALALLGEDSSLSVLAMLASAILGVMVGIFLFAQGWIWSQRAWRRGYAGRSVAIAFAGGFMILLAAFALAGVVILLLLFYVA
jgi:hypothetical protein